MEVVARSMATTNEPPVGGGSHQGNNVVINGDLKEENIDTSYAVHFDKNEVEAPEQPENGESLVDKIVEDTRSGELEEGHNILKVKGGKQHIQFGFEGNESEDEEEEEVEMEEVELEFENVVPKLHTHNAYCPNCDAQITKVVLRRRIPKKILTPLTSTQHPKEEERELVGCLSCFSIFVPKANKLDPFPIFGGADDTHQLESIPKSTPKEIGCDPFAMFRRKEENREVPNAKLSQPNKEEIPSATQKGDRTSLSSSGGQGVTTARKQGYETLPLPSVNSGDISISIRDLPGTSGLYNPLGPINEVQSNSLEMVKSIVYGGLAESITSITVVSSAAASGAATLNIVALGLANLIAGLFLLVQNLSNLKNGQQEEKYKEALGRKEHFSVHALTAITSYLVFGLIPPIIYGFTFQDTDDKDFKLFAVAAASLICIILLAIGKAYITQAQQIHKFSTYLNFVVYYVATAALVSGVGYVVGEKAKTLLENIGWFHYPRDQASTTLFFHGSNTLLEPSFASY